MKERDGDANAVSLTVRKAMWCFRRTTADCGKDRISMTGTSRFTRSAVCV